MKTAQNIMQVLMDAGHEAYIIGGTVRDALLGLDHKDIDIATSASVEEIRKLFTLQGWKTIDVGAAFGVILVVIDGITYDVATFRTETYGEDCHRPEQVNFCATLIEDLARRDFTINAIAQDIHGKYIDPFGGIGDLCHGVIRTVGIPNERFIEDGLRMFRAARFVATLGFELEKETLAAIPANLPRVRGLSVERVKVELEKTLCGKYAAKGLRTLQETGLLNEVCRAREDKRETYIPILPELSHLVNLPQSPRYHYLDGWRHTLSVVENISGQLTLRWAALLHDVAKGLPGVRCTNRSGEMADYGHKDVGAEMAAEILKRLRVNIPIAQRVAWLIEHHIDLPKADRAIVLKWLRRFASHFKNPEDLREAVFQLLELHRADRIAGHTHPDLEGLNSVKKMVEEMLSTVPFYISELAITGGYVAEKLGAGPQVKRFQAALLSRVQVGELPNTREALLAAVDKRAEKLSKDL